MDSWTARIRRALKLGLDFCTSIVAPDWIADGVAERMLGQRWLRFFEQNSCVVKWNSCQGSG
jgi:hypothetical protein